MNPSPRSEGIACGKRHAPLLALYVVLVSAWALVLGPAGTGSAYAQGGEGRLKQLNEQVEKARAKGKADLEADALYDLAKAQFEAGDLPSAEANMRAALAKEVSLNRVGSQLRTRVALASMLVAARKHAEALAAYKEAYEYCERQDMKDQAASIVNSMGAICLVEGRLEEAETHFKKGLALARASEDPTGECNALVNLGVVARAQGKATPAVEYLGQALSLLKEGQNDRLLASVLAEMGNAQADSGNLVEAASSLKRAAEMSREEMDAFSTGKAELYLGQVFIKQGKPREAVTALSEAAKEFAAAKRPTLKADALIALADAQAAAGEYKQCDGSLAEAMAIAREAADKGRERQVFSESGYSYLLRGSPEGALGKFLDAYSLFSKQGTVDSKTRSVLLTDLAVCYKALGQFEAAVNYYQQAVSELEKAQDERALALALSSLSVAYLDSGRVPDFDSTWQRARQIYKHLADQKGQALLAYNRAQYELVQGHFADAVALYEEALAGMRATGDTAGEGQVLRGLGLGYLCLGRAGKAQECYREALPLASAGSIDAQWDCALGLGKCYKALGQLDTAVQQLQKAVDLVESERSQLSKDTFKTFNMDLRQDCFMELVDVLVKAGRKEEALAMAEKGRARAFLDMLEGRKSVRPSEGLRGGLLPSEPEKTARLTAADIAGGVPQAGSRAVEIVRKASSFVEATAVSPLNALPPSLDEMRALVSRNGSTFVEYFVLSDKVLIWVVHPDGKIEMPPPVVVSRRALEEKIAANLKVVTSNPKSPAEMGEHARRRESGLEELYRLLFEPVVPLLPKDPQAVVTVVPHGPLFLVPFAALMSGDRRYLVEDHTLAYVPAIGVLRATEKLRQETVGAADNLLAFGNPITKEIAFLGALPYSEKEVQHIADLFGPAKARVEIGQKANKAAFRTLGPQSTVVHLATHGLVNEERPMDSALVLAPSGADDGLLTVKDILQMPPLKARLVTLSACQTGRGKITGDGVVGLSRAFIIAGTPSVIVSQWNVDDVMTEYEMVAFYRSFLAHADKAKALRDAQIATITFLEKSPASLSGVKPPRANPRYWAAFQLIGECKQ